MADKPSQVMRTGRGTSMWSAIEAVRDGEAEVVVSCGNTGALMAVSMLRLRKLPGVNRPAIAILWPSRRASGFTVMLDVGADVRADAEDLVQYALMGASYARNGLGLDRPEVGLLNVGTEENKGRAELRDAHDRIEAVAPGAGFDFAGFVEGGDIPSDRVDVVVTDGFTGNVALKTGEGTAGFVRDMLGEAFRATPLSRVAALLAMSSLKRLSKRIDPRRVNGGVFLGLNGTVVKSHGSADETGVGRGHRPGLGPQRVGLLGAAARARRRRERADGGGVVIRSVVAGVGHHLPERVVPNDWFAGFLDTSDDWIRDRTGIERRHFAAEGEVTSDLATRAAAAALADAGLVADDVDAIVLATSTPDLTFPATATIVQAKLGMTRGFAFDVQAVCAGFIYALAQADAMIVAGQVRRVLVIGAETFSRILDWEDRTTAVLFGDGAGAVVLEAAEGAGTSDDRGILAVELQSDGRHRDILRVDGGVSSTGTAGHLVMAGREVFRHAVEKLARATVDVLAKAGLGMEAIDRVVPHQANVRIIARTADKLGVPMEKVVVTVADHGNTSAASIPMAMSVAAARGDLVRGELVVSEAIGGGLAWGAIVMRW